LNRNDAAAGLLLMLLAGAFYWLAAGLPVSALADSVGPARLPMVLSVVLGAVGLVIAARALLSRPARQHPGNEQGEGAADATPLRAAGFAAIAAAYVLLVSFIGYVMAIALLIAAVALYEGEKPSLRLAIVAAGGAVAFWLLFVKLLGVPQPPGLLG
jgi:hypothetical protein